MEEVCVTGSLDNDRRWPYRSPSGLIDSFLWFIFEPSTFDWHAIATLIVWTMTLFIQRADRRDTLAVHAKLDELLKATHDARTELASIDENEPEVIERIRDRERRDAQTK
jgi:hypothetical protein